MMTSSFSKSIISNLSESDCLNTSANPSNSQDTISYSQFTVFSNSFDNFAYDRHIQSRSELFAKNSVTEYFANIYNAFDNPNYKFSEENEQQIATNNNNYSNFIVAKDIEVPESFENKVGNLNISDNISDSEDTSIDSDTFGQVFSDSECSQLSFSSSASSPLEISFSENNINFLAKTKKKSLRHSLYNNEKKNKYGCNFCGKFFPRPSSLRTHVNTHTGDKPFVCLYKNCNKEFNARSNMTRHYKSHFKVSSSGYLLPSGKIVHEKPSLKQLTTDDI